MNSEIILPSLESMLRSSTLSISESHVNLDHWGKTWSNVECFNLEIEYKGYLTKKYIMFSLMLIAFLCFITKFPIFTLVGVVLSYMFIQRNLMPELLVTMQLKVTDKIQFSNGNYILGGYTSFFKKLSVEELSCLENLANRYEEIFKLKTEISNNRELIYLDYIILIRLSYALAEKESFVEEKDNPFNRINLSYKY